MNPSTRRLAATSAVLLLVLSAACRCREAPTASGAPPPAPIDAHASVAVLPFVGPDGTAGWLGMAVADRLTTRLLVQPRADPKAKEVRYPLNVFSWRQSLAAARGEDIRPADFTARAAELRTALGADQLLEGSWRVDDGRATLTWRLVGAAAGPVHEQACDLAAVSQATDEIAAQVLAAFAPGSPPKPFGNEFQALPPQALREFGEALEILSTQSLDPRARVVIGRPQLDRAAELLAAVVTAAPSFARGWTERGVVASLRQDFAGATEALEQASAQKDHPEPSTALGIVSLYERQQQHAVALRTLEGTVATYPGSLQALGYLGEAYLRDRRFDDALRVYTSYAARVPASFWARLRRGVALSRLGRHDEAMAEAREVVAKHPQSMTALGALASREIDAGRWDEARATLAKGLAARPDHPLFLTRLSYVELDTGSPANALALAEKAVAALGLGRGEPLAGYAHVDLAHALALVGRREEAYVAVAKARELGIGEEELERLTGDARLKDFLADPRSSLAARPAASK